MRLHAARPGEAPRVEPDAIVVGSGFGGAVVAARLAERGLRVIVTEAALPVRALPLPPLIRRRLQGTIALLTFGRERAVSRLALREGALVSDASRDADPALYAAMLAATRAVAAGFDPRRAFLDVPGGPGRGPLVSVHPLGGAAVGRAPGDGVVDHAGRVFGHPGLFVVDGSVYPAAPGLAPSMTIAAFAERAAAQATEA
jgi:cholesterol oxidase